MSAFKLTYKPFNARSILIEWPSKIDKNIIHEVRQFKNILEQHYIKQKVYVINAYSSLLINYDFVIENIYDEVLILKELYKFKVEKQNLLHTLWKIPVCYDTEFADDIEVISKEKNLSKEDIIRLHTEATYTVYFMGFLPGFLYLGGLDKRLYFSRKASPKMHVKKGAVGIGETQTGIYPNVSPGGWHIIGNSPINFFDVNNTEPCFAKPGDEINFFSITTPQFYNIQKLVKEQAYNLESQVVYG